MVRITSPGRQPLQLVVSAALDLGREGDGLLLADDRVSRRHARLEPAAGGGITVSDLGSANGVIVNGELIHEPTVLGVGGIAILGDTRVEVVAQALGGLGAVATTTTMTSSTAGGPTAIEQVAEQVNDIRTPGLIDVADEPGTLTIGFSDIESSTEHTVRVGDNRWIEILTNHNALIERQVAAHGGRIVRNQGDGFMMCFRSARLSVFAAIAIQHELAALERDDPDMAVRVRMGLHTGEVLQDDEGDLFGRHVQLAAQIGDLADGTQILVSGVLKQITEPRGDLTFGEAVLVQLRGLDDPQVVHDVDWRAISFDG